MKNLVKLGIILCMFASIQNLCMAYNPYVLFKIPKKTAEIADKSPEVVPQVNNIPSSEVVKVGIGTTGFKTYLYDNVGIYGTSNIILCDNNTAIKTFPANTNIIVKINSSKTFDITLENGEKIATLQGPVRFTCPTGLLGVKGLKRAGVNATYHGAFEIDGVNNKFNLVNIIEVEDYLKGVVPNEMPVTFGENALKAQSVAARNYVLSPRTKASKNYDVVDSVASQVYYGAGTEKTLSNEAVKETEGICAIYNWNLILAQYSSTAGGYTESYSQSFSDPITRAFPSKDKPYLMSKPDIIGQTPLNTDDTALNYYKSTPDSYDIRSPYYRWQREWEVNELHDVLQQNLPAQSATGFVKPAFNSGDILGNLIDIKVNKRGNSGKIVEMEIFTDNGNYKVQKELVIRRLMTKSGKALPSANMAFELTKDDLGNLQNIKVYGGGFGHGVGMSQFGAGFMGKELNIPYYKILQHYYTGISLGTKPFVISKDAPQLTQHFYNSNNYAKIKIDNKFNVSKLTIKINGNEQIIELPKSFAQEKRFTEIDISPNINKGRNEITFIYPKDAQGNLRIYIELVKKDDNNGIW